MVGRRLVLAVMAGMLLAAGGVVLLGQAQARQALEERFGLRATLGANFVASYAGDIIRREQSIASADLGAETVTADDFGQVVRTFGFEAAILLDEEGSVLHAVPLAPGLIGTNLADKYEHLRNATSGVAAVSNGVASAATGHPIVAFAAPFDTQHGRRVLSGGHYLGETPLSAYLRSAIPFSAASAYLVDANGFVVESNTQGEGEASVTSLVALNEQLMDAIEGGSHGSYIRDGIEERFAAEEINGTPLRRAKQS